MEKPNNKHGIPNEVYSSWLETATNAYKEQGSLTGAAQFTHNDTTYVVRKKGNYKDGSPRFAITPKLDKQATQGAREQGLKSKPLTKEQRAESAAKQQAIRDAGQIPDHLNEQWIVNQTRQSSTPEEFQRIQQVYPMGQDPENIQPLDTQSENTKKTSDWRKVQRSLGQAEATRPSESLLSQFSPEERRQLDKAPDLDSKADLVSKFKANKGLTAARLARNVAPLALSVPIGIGVAGQSAAAAVKDPTQDNVVNAGFDVANSLADLVGLIPTPLTVGASEGLQRALMLGQMTYNSQRTLQRLADMKNK